ncbi:hypothetical protein WICMUC_004042 [Wickerhamomyces mucosus]|uniref:Uncharacterized protein n=1 Tax=Wickerhamomyces mucosus TaxID=1378264 RepID=A0A9P8PJS2_9ASCO|nr:hypothetical protein WICMUC_004042 [Wickerhamomyces mucosus]
MSESNEQKEVNTEFDSNSNNDELKTNDDQSSTIVTNRGNHDEINNNPKSPSVLDNDQIDRQDDDKDIENDEDNNNNANNKLENSTEIPTPTPDEDFDQQNISITLSESSKRKDEEDREELTQSRRKRSRKLQGAGVKKPLYSRYESLYIIKAFKTISDKHSNLVLIDLFKIVAILFNEEAQRQGFKERTSDQLYQKYKRIQHGLNHGEVEFLDFFTRNKINQKEWIPDFSKVEKSDKILKYIKFPQLDEAINEVLGSTISNLKPPLPDLYGDDDESHDDEYQNQSETEDHHKDPDEELLKLAGYNHNSSSTSSSSSSSRDLELLKNQIIELKEQLSIQRDQIEILKNNEIFKDQEIKFLKNMIKEDLSYIRHKLNENNNNNTNNANNYDQQTQRKKHDSYRNGDQDQ